MKHKWIATLSLLCLTAAAPAFDAKTSADHGRDILDRVLAKMPLEGSDLFVQELKPKEANYKPAPDDCWAAGVQLTALTAAAKVDPDHYLSPLKKYVAGLDTFRATVNGIEGYDDGPHPKPPDRFYDDNAWIALGMIEAYEITHDAKDLERAKVALGLTLSGEDDNLGGGLYWREGHLDSKNTCSNAPGIVAAVRMYAITKDQKTLDTAVRLYKWTRSKLLDPADHLYWDNITLAGEIKDHKYTYNSALMIRAGCVLFDATGDKTYLTDAQATADSSLSHWFSPTSGAIADTSYFAHLMCEALLELTARDHDPKWADADHRAVGFVFEKSRDPDGFYPEHWDRTIKNPIEDIRLINQASAARLFFRAAWPS